VGENILKSIMREPYWARKRKHIKRDWGGPHVCLNIRKKKKKPWGESKNQENSEQKGAEEL